MAPPMIKSEKAEEKALLQVANIMLIAARTAPKAAGKDDILTLIVYGKEKDAIAARMDKMGMERKIEAFKRDAENVRNSEAIVLIGVRGRNNAGLDCGGCGYASCAKFERGGMRVGNDFAGPNCIFKGLDLGISLGSAVKIASFLNVDNRMMYRIGTAALKMGMLLEATVLMGIPISAKGKNIYFDRGK